MNKEYNEWYWKVYRWFKWDAKHFHKDIEYGLKNLWKWFPTIWKDRDWDNHFIFEVLEFKLDNMVIAFQDKQKFEGWEDDVRYMKICKKLIERIQDNYYQDEYFDYIDLDLEIVNTGSTFKLEETIHRDDVVEYLAKYPNTYKLIKSNPKYKGYQKDMGLALAVGMELHLKARKLLFKILEEKIEGWWE
jgi:hypothetical protein